MSNTVCCAAAIDCTADEIVITSGSGQGLDLVNNLLLAKGDTVLVEQETYGGALTKLTRLGVNAIGIPLDDEGLRLDALKQTIRERSYSGSSNRKAAPARHSDRDLLAITESPHPHATAAIAGS